MCEKVFTSTVTISAISTEAGFGLEQGQLSAHRSVRCQSLHSPAEHLVLALLVVLVQVLGYVLQVEVQSEQLLKQVLLEVLSA